jgi:hypothetical protein
VRADRREQAPEAEAVDAQDPGGQPRVARVLVALEMPGVEAAEEGRRVRPRVVEGVVVGMPYGPALAPGARDDGEDRGLVFVSLQTSIERQFEIVRARWLNDGDAFGLGRTPDPVAGTVTRPARQVFGGRPPRYATAMRAFVVPRGGEYLFVPGIAGLRAFATL